MSIKETSRVWETSKQDSTALLLLLSLADCADDWGHCWPGRKFLAKHARCDIATVSRLVAKLIRDDELYAARQTGRGTHYVILCGLSPADQIDRRRKLDKLFPGSDILQLPPNQSSDSVITTGSDGVITRGSDIDTGKTVLDPSVEPSLEPSIAPTPRTKPAKEPKPRKANPIFDAIAKGSFSISDSSKLNGAGGRVGALVAWLKEADPDCTPEKLEQFYSWYAAEFSEAAAPRALEKFGEHYARFMETDGKSGSTGPAVIRNWTINKDGNIES